MRPPAWSSEFTRRGVLKASGAVLLGGLAGDSARLRAAASAATRSSAERVILFWCSGGMSQLDSWDPKPGRPTQGEFHAIPTSVPGIEISELFPQLARQLHHCTLIRSLTGDFDEHIPATRQMLTEQQSADERQAPALGSLCARHFGDSANVPAFVSISGRPPGAGSLGKRYAAQVVPSPDDERLQLAFPESPRETGDRRSVPQTLHNHDEDIFRLRDISAETRDRYGETTFGRGTLLAKQLVERGVRFVQVHRGGFDTHADNFHTMHVHGEVMDRALAALISDLARSGLLSTTLVLVLSEFGRSPQINVHAGRDHWAECFSCLIAGGGIPGGAVIGGSDRDGYRSLDEPIRIADLHATIYRALGIDFSYASAYLPAR